MKSIRAEVKTLSSFKQLAIKESNAQSRLQKGLIGNVYSGQFAPSLDKIVMKMQAGELSQVIDLPTGLVLFYCEKNINTPHKTDKQLKEIVTKNLQTELSNQKWQEYQQQLQEKLNLIYHWDIIQNKGQDQATVVGNLLFQLSKQQLLWLLNGYNGSKPLSAFNHKEIVVKVQNYFVNKNIFSQLALDAQDVILSGMKSQYINRITSEVMVMLVAPRLKKLSDKEIQSYYDKHTNQLLTAKTYDLSALGLEINKKNRKKIYKKLESIYYDVVTLQADFEQAIEKYSIIDKSFPNLNLNKLSDKRLSTIFGVRAANSIRLMPPGEISDLIEIGSGYLWIVRLNAIIEPRPYQLSEVRQFIEDKLNSQRADEIQNLISTELLEKQKIILLPKS
jgi:hypothetical protein